MKTRYSRLTLAERRQIERWWLMNMSATEIARRLARHRSTEFRELRRNRHHDAELPELSGYWGVLAQKSGARPPFPAPEACPLSRVEPASHRLFEGGLVAGANCRADAVRRGSV